MPTLGSSFALSGSGPKKEAPTSLAVISEWYNSLSDPKAKSIQTVQIRKDPTGAVPHRFVVLRMCNGQNHRLDRRPERGPDGDATMVGLLVNRAVTSQDSYVLDISMEKEERNSQCEIELFLYGRVDLSTVISACSAMSSDTSASKYTLFRHNCFFFSWTILMIVSRHHLPYEIPPRQQVIERYQSELEQMTPFIVKEAVELFLDLVIDTMTIFRKNAGTSLRQGMNVAGRAAWALPIGVLRFLWRRLFTVRLHLGLRKQLTKMISQELAKTMGSVYDTTRSTHMTHDMFNEHLWIEQTKSAVKKGLETETLKVLWRFILEAISAGLGDIEPEQLAKELTDPNLKFSLLGRNAAQFCAVWNAALHGGLQAVKGVAQDVAGLSHAAAFDQAWDAARGAALEAAQTVVTNTSKTMNKPEREKMWNEVWGIWSVCWVDAHKIVQPRSVQVVEKIVEAILAAGTKVESKWLSRRNNETQPNITNAKLQEYMENIIKKDTLNAEMLGEVRSSMERVWKDTRQHLLASKPLNAITEHV